MVRPAIEHRAILDLHTAGLETLADRFQHAEKQGRTVSMPPRSGA